MFSRVKLAAIECNTAPMRLAQKSKAPAISPGQQHVLASQKNWHELKPEQFENEPYHLPGCKT